MVVSAPELAPLFRSDTQGEILARLLLNPDHAYSIAQLARMTRSSYASAHREVQLLVRTEVATETRVGNYSQVAANPASPVNQALTDLVLWAYGPVAVVPRALGSVGGIQQAYIYGSWAARRAGQPGSPPADIDVLVVGNPDRQALYDAADTAEAELGRPVNIRAVATATWNNDNDSFIHTVRTSPLIPLALQERT
jgi:predicted nucleotidyltransferase